MSVSEKGVKGVVNLTKLLKLSVPIPAGV
jgi:hypothetical protein